MPFLSSTVSHGFDGTYKISIDKTLMDSTISPTSPLFLPLSQLHPYCTKLLSSLHDDDASKKDIIALEQNLWKEVKKLKALQDKENIFTYLIGYYHTILFRLVKINESDDIFQYHILIRLGDLNRYLDRLETAEYYYCNARNLFPNYGHAYNQLGLLTRSENFYKCCYYYARAAKSTKRPLEKNLAESNLRIALRDHDNSILNVISNNDSNASNKSYGQSDDKTIDNNVVLPDTAFDWFYVIVIALYFDNLHPVAKPFMRYMMENFTPRIEKIISGGVKLETFICDRNNYLLLACLDTLLDWLKFDKGGKEVCLKIKNELRHMREKISSIIDSINVKCHNRELAGEDSRTVHNSTPTAPEILKIKSVSGPSNSTPISPSSLNTSDASSSYSTRTSQSFPRERLLALPHDCVLKGFKPLERVHENLRFPKELPVFNGSNGKLDEFGGEFLQEHSFIGPEQLMIILTRIKVKIDSFGLLLKRKTRNIALESILSSMSSCNSDQFA